MPAKHFIGLIPLLQLASCAIIAPTTPPPAPAAMQGGTVVVERLPPVTMQSRPDMAQLPLSTGTVIVERLPPPETAPVTTPSTITAPAVTITPDIRTATADKPAAKVTAPVARALPPQKPRSTALVPATAPSLGLATLEQRLKDTDAIGLFTKITLKNQIDDLLKQFKAHHEGKSKAALTQLRQGYDQLLLKVKDLLKNGDPSLASEIMNSREAIWGVLTDPVKFATL